MSEEPTPDRRQINIEHIDNEDISDHRAVYVGVHVPLSPSLAEQHKRHHHHHRHRRHHHEKRQRRSSTEEKSDTSEEFGTAPANRVQFILGEEDEENGAHEVFTEMEELCSLSDGEKLWKETARWVKFEEDVEEGGNRWSKPHVATLSLHSLFELRNLIMNGTVVLDMNAHNLETIIDIVLDKWVESERVEKEVKSQIREALLCQHQHQHQRPLERVGSKLRHQALHRVSSSKSSMSSSITEGNEGEALKKKLSSSSSLIKKGSLDISSDKPKATSSASLSSHPTDNETDRDSLHSLHDVSKIHKDHEGKKPGQASRFLRRLSLQISQQDQSTNLMRKIPQGAEASNVLVGEVEFLDKPLTAFVRLHESLMLGDLTEIPIPTRFLFILLGPTANQTSANKYHEIGRCISAMMSDAVFHNVAYKAKSRNDLLSGIDEFMDQVTVLPPGEWDPSIRIQPPSTAPSNEMRRKSAMITAETLNGLNLGELVSPAAEDQQDGLQKTGRLFGGLIEDIKRKKPFYLSDFKDSLKIQCLASIIFLFFASITPAVTFGGILGRTTQNQMGALESVFGVAICGVLYALLAGQPLIILSITGPLLVFEQILAVFCRDMGLEYLPFRMWSGFWSAAICLLLLAFETSTLVRYFTRFVEESFAALISFIFIAEAFQELIHIFNDYPIDGCHHPCYCQIPGNFSHLILEDPVDIPLDQCELVLNGTLAGNCDLNTVKCENVFLVSLVLLLGTFTIAFGLNIFKNSSYFPTKIREIMSDFSVFVAVILMVVIDIAFKIRTPKLDVPGTFEPTSERGWLVPPFGRNPWWTCLAAIVPAFLATILIFMDQQISAVIINRKEHKLKKGPGYHLDLLIIAICLVLCSLFGLPWFVSETVLSISHVQSLRVETQVNAPGEQPKFLGVREQRVTGLAVSFLVGLSVLMTPILKLIPMPVLYGVFLYMGIASLNGIQFFDRLKLFLMPVKHQPDYIYLRHVELKKVYIFTAIQLFSLASMWVVKSTEAAIVFPLMILALVGVRKVMECGGLFSPHELEMLDDLMPESLKRKKDDYEKRMSEDPDDDDDEDVNVPILNTLPMKKIVSDEENSVNISKEMAKTAIWKQLELGNGGGKSKTTKKRYLDDYRHYKTAKKPKSNQSVPQIKLSDDEEAQILSRPPVNETPV